MEKRTNADNLHLMANINIVVSVISAIMIWINFSTIKVKYSTELNWWGIIAGIAMLIIGFTVFFLLRTIVDIYCEVEK